MPSTLRFLGAAGTVTGSRFLLKVDHRRLLVDCGLFQGLKELRLRNWDPFPAEPKSISEVLLTHAHLDHSGFLPGLVRDGFSGTIFATAGTIDLSRILLPDSGRLQEEEASYANRKAYSRHSPARPLYTEEDALKAGRRFSTVDFDSRFKLDAGTFATFRQAGHILGSSSILIETNSRRLFFSGDVGRPHHPLLLPPAPIPAADILAVESTYGDRTHDDEAAIANFADSIARTAARGGTIVIPSFAVDRTEVVLFHLRQLIEQGRIPSIPVYVDSPMALAALNVYKTRVKAHGAEVRPEVAGKPELLEPGLLHEVRTTEESMALNRLDGPMIIISASGMATGGRVLHHLSHRLPDARNLVILVGYQAEGTRGRLLLNGASAVKMLGRYIPVSAEIVNVPAFSVHADKREMLAWLATAPQRPEVVYVVHGDPAAAESLRAAVCKELGWNAVVPHHLEQVRID